MTDTKVDVSGLTAQDLLALPPEVLAEAWFLHPGRGAMGRAKPAEFHALMASGVNANVEIVPFSPGSGQFMQVFRHDDDFHGWHFPGGLVHQFDALAATCRRVMLKEFGIDLSAQSFRCIAVCNYNNPKSDQRHYRGVCYGNHLVGLVFVVALSQTITFPKEGIRSDWFYDPPEEILESHRPIFLTAREWYKKIWRVPVIEG